MIRNVDWRYWIGAGFGLAHPIGAMMARRRWTTRRFSGREYWAEVTGRSE